MLILLTVSILYYYARRNPSLFDPLTARFSSTIWRGSARAKLECLGVVLAYAALCYLSRSVPFARLVQVVPQFVYGVVVRGCQVVVRVLRELGGSVWAECGWGKRDGVGAVGDAVAAAAVGGESWLYKVGKGVMGFLDWVIRAEREVLWLEELVTVAMAVMF